MHTNMNNKQYESSLCRVILCSGKPGMLCSFLRGFKDVLSNNWALWKFEEASLCLAVSSMRPKPVVASQHCCSFRAGSVKYSKGSWREAKPVCLVFADVLEDQCNASVRLCVPVHFFWGNPQAYLVAYVMLKMIWDVMHHTPMHRMYFYHGWTYLLCCLLCWTPVVW